MSCVARSFTTPTSAIRFGNGPWRRVTTWNTSPSSPCSSRLRKFCKEGLNRSMCPTAPTRPACSNASVNCVAASTSGAKGFSISACTPASASASPISVWNTVGTATTAKSIPTPMSSSTEESTGRPFATPWVSPPGSATATSSTPSRDPRTRAW